MKKLVFLCSFLLLTQIFEAKAQCSFTASVSGHTATFTYIWPIIGIQSLDSVRFNYGDGTTQLFTIPVIGNSTHTYVNPGVYTVCITRYLSSLGNPGVPIICTSCQIVTIASNNPCAANTNFTYVITGSNVAFTNTTLCPSCPSLFSNWNYGDGTATSSNFQGNHSYANPGTYMVCLISTINDSVGGLICTDTFCTTVVITASSNNCSATANFTSTSSGNTASFTNSSLCTSCSSTNYSWNFGDGSPLNTSTNPSHTYATSGSYNVCLTITGISSSGSPCTDTFCDSVNVNSTTPNPCFANAAFTNTATALTANFTNTSTCTSCTSTVYSWNFGDGSLPSPLMNPTHTYATAGTYNVCLTLTGISQTGFTCQDTTCMAVTVQANPNGCIATAAFTSSAVANNVSFTNTSTCTSCTTTTYSWNFGDLSPLNTTMSPSHMYSSNGSFIACLIISGTAANGSICKDTLCKNVVVTGLGLNDIYQNKLDIYPNPTTNSVWVTLPVNVVANKLQIVDVAGRTLAEMNVDKTQLSKIELNLSNYTKGLYFIKLTTQQGIYSSRIIKQ